MSIMMGIETAIRSLRAHTLAINTAEHNIANMNNDWYSRQIASITAADPYSIVGMPGQIGAGSQIGGYERVRSLYLDRQIMAEREKLGMWEMINTTYKNLAALFPEVNGVSMGLDKQLQDFWDNWQALADAAALPDTDATKADKIKAAQLKIYSTADGMGRSFNEKASALTDMQVDLNTELRVSVQKINMYIKEVYELNNQIVTAYNMNQTPNDLLDKRVQALSKLSELVNINVGERGDGSVVVHIHGHVLVSGADDYNEMTTVGGAKDSKLEDVALLEYKGGQPVSIDQFIEGGLLAGVKRSRDEVIHWYKSQLDSMANSIITVVNKIHRTGLNPSTGNQSDMDFFVGNKASSIVVNPQLNSGLMINYRKYSDNDIAEIMANLHNKIINNSITSTPYDADLNNKSATLLGRNGTITINGTTINYSAGETVATLVDRINGNVSDISAVFNDTTQQFFIVSNQLMTIKETHDGPDSLMVSYGWMEEQTSSGPVNYAESTARGRISMIQQWQNQKLLLDYETSKYGRMALNFDGKKYYIDWSYTDIPQQTSRDIVYFNGVTNIPHLSFYSLDNNTQKFQFRSGVNFDNGGTADTILPFLVTDETGNMTQVMKLTGNLRFSEFYDTIIGKLAGELDTGENLTMEYRNALEQLINLQQSITEVDENQEIMLAKQYQRAYDASVRLMSVMDEMLNMLINRTASPSSNWD